MGNTFTNLKARLKRQKKEEPVLDSSEGHEGQGKTTVLKSVSFEAVEKEELNEEKRSSNDNKLAIPTQKKTLRRANTKEKTFEAWGLCSDIPNRLVAPTSFPADSDSSSSPNNSPEKAEKEQIESNMDVKKTVPHTLLKNSRMGSSNSLDGGKDLTVLSVRVSLAGKSVPNLLKGDTPTMPNSSPGIGSTTSSTVTLSMTPSLQTTTSMLSSSVSLSGSREVQTPSPTTSPERQLTGSPMGSPASPGHRSGNSPGYFKFSSPSIKSYSVHSSPALKDNVDDNTSPGTISAKMESIIYDGADLEGLKLVVPRSNTAMGQEEPARNSLTVINDAALSYSSVHLKSKRDSSTSCKSLPGSIESPPKETKLTAECDSTLIDH